MPSFGQKVMQFHDQLEFNVSLPAGFQALLPFKEDTTRSIMQRFYEKYYADTRARIFIFGINPGRFGGGLTGVPFTDPIRLESACGIPNNFMKKAELSSIFVYQVINAFGGNKAFYDRFYITSLSPVGFMRNGKNANYYDDRHLQTAAEPFITDSIKTQLAFGNASAECICLGEGKNFEYFSKLNEKHGFFEKIHPLAHPRFVMQYKSRETGKYVEKYIEVLKKLASN